MSFMPRRAIDPTGGVDRRKLAGLVEPEMRAKPTAPEDR